MTDMTYEQVVERADWIASRPSESPGPGRYEGNDDRQVAELLDSLSNDTSFLDAEVGRTEEQGWFARIGRFLVEEDDQGFFSYQDFETEDAAKAAFEKIESTYYRCAHGKEDSDDCPECRKEAEF